MRVRHVRHVRHGLKAESSYGHSELLVSDAARAVIIARM